MLETNLVSPEVILIQLVRAPNKKALPLFLIIPGKGIGKRILVINFGREGWQGFDG